MGMKIDLARQTEGYIEGPVHSGTFESASAFVEEATRRQMQEEAWFEEKVLEGLQGAVTPLTGSDLQSVRDIVKKGRAGKSL
jgi:Arc/MetJ-type ribon-helix-helix transcriptional regulator